MKLNEYIKELKKLHKEYGNIDLFYSIDDEGNAYNEVVFLPTVGRMNRGNFITHMRYAHEVDGITEQEIKDNYCTEEEVNCICLT